MSEATTQTCTCQDSDTTQTCNGGITANVALNLACPGEYRIYLCSDCEVMGGDTQGQGACPECPDCPPVDSEPSVPGPPVDSEPSVPGPPVDSEPSVPGPPVDSVPVYRNKDQSKFYSKGDFDGQGRLLVTGGTHNIGGKPSSYGLLERYNADMTAGQSVHIGALMNTNFICEAEGTIYCAGTKLVGTTSDPVICQLDTELEMVRAKVFPSISMSKLTELGGRLFLLGADQIDGSTKGIMATFDTELKQLNARLVEGEQPETYINDIYERNGRLYAVGHKHGYLVELDAQLNVIASKQLSIASSFRHILFSPKGDLWACCDDHLYQLSPELTLLNAYQISYPAEHFGMMNLVFDAEYNIWLSSMDGRLPVVIKLASDTSVLAVWKGEEDSFFPSDLVASDDGQTLAFIGNTYGQTPNYGVLFNNHLLETDPAAGGFELLDPAVIEVTPVDTPLEDLLKPIEVSLVDYDLEASDIDIGVTVTDIDMSAQ